jgi:hypothetical protein
MRKTVNLSLDRDTIEMLKQQSIKLHLSKSALVRLLIIQNEKQKLIGGENNNDK